MLEFYSKRNVKAKKQHICDNCGKAIELGETYSYLAYKDDGEIWQIKSHLDCEQAQIEIHDTFYEGDSEYWCFLNEQLLYDEAEIREGIVELLKTKYPFVYLRMKDRIND
jgi:hypothetical protein